MDDKYRELITFLDAALTGHKYEDCLHTFNCSVARDPMKLLEGEQYYLSDGGYSRIFWDIWNDRGICLDSVSRQEVKEAWERCKELIADLNKYLLPLVSL